MPPEGVASEKSPAFFSQNESVRRAQDPTTVSMKRTLSRPDIETDLNTIDGVPERESGT